MAASPYDKDTKTLISEFFEAFLNENGCRCIITRNRKDTEKTANVFIVEHVRAVFPDYSRIYSNDYKRLNKFFSDILEVQNLRDGTLSMGIPYFGVHDVRRYLELEVTWLTITAFFLLLGNFLVQYNRVTGKIEFIDQVVNCLSEYIAEMYLDQINKLGGWKVFCMKFVEYAEPSAAMATVFSRFVDKCLNFHRESLESLEAKRLEGVL